MASEIRTLRDENQALRQDGQEQAEEIRHLKEMLRLAHDKCAEQVRQARWEVATEGLKQPTDGDEHRYLVRVRDANAPKD